ncbi:hypothetical protein CRYUN_Cryun08bG0061100 [Craigia yunnanensis]
MAAAFVLESFSGDEEKRGEDEQGELLPLPIGYRFVPHDHELILEYLMNKIMGFQLPSNIIKDIDFYDLDPHEFPTKKANCLRDLGDFKYGITKNEAYYFTQTQQRYSKTERTKRSSKSGCWKACGKEREINCGGRTVGFKTIFVFYWRNELNGIGKKSSWVMHEFRVNPRNVPTDQALDDSIKAKIQRCVICRLQIKDGRSEIENGQYSLLQMR